MRLDDDGEVYKEAKKRASSHRHLVENQKFFNHTQDEDDEFAGSFATS